MLHERLSADRIDPAQSVTVEVDVTNSGSRPGVEVVQLYIQDEVASITRPVKELRQFEKVHLAPGASQTITFTLTPSDLAFYGPTMERIIEPGFFKVFVGTNSRDVREARFEWHDE